MPNKESLSEKVIRTIKRDIQVNKITPEQIITENQICESLDMSRTPVREALIHLTADGLLKKIPNKGYSVQVIDSKQKIDIYTIFSTLESLAATLAINNLVEEDFIKMNECIEKINISVKYKNCLDYYALNDEFHNIYISKCNNKQLINMIKGLESGPINRSYVNNCDNMLFKAFDECNSQHKDIIRYFKDKNIEALKALHVDHWKTKYIDMI